MNEKSKELEVLSQRIRKGDVDAFALLIEKLKEELIGIAYRMMEDLDEAKDVVQECFIKLWDSRGRIRKEGNIRFLLRRMVVNLSLDLLRRRKRESQMRKAVLREGREIFELPSGEQERFVRELSLIFSHLSNELPEQERTIFILREIEGLSTDEVARILDIAPSTVRNHLMHARAHLRREIKSRYPELLNYWKKL